MSFAALSVATIPVSAEYALILSLRSDKSVSAVLTLFCARVTPAEMVLPTVFLPSSVFCLKMY